MTNDVAQSSCDRDDGYATVWVVTAMALVVVAATIAIGYGVAIVERHRAASAADAAALGAALWVIDGPSTACAKAAAVARLDGAVQTRCEVLGAVVEVTVAVRLPGPLAALGTAVGQARAGPVGMTLFDPSER